MKPMISRRSTSLGKPVSANCRTPRLIQSVTTSAVARRSGSSVLATSSAIAAIGQASATDVLIR